MGICRCQEIRQPALEWRNTDSRSQFYNEVVCLFVCFNEAIGQNKKGVTLFSTLQCKCISLIFFILLSFIELVIIGALRVLCIFEPAIFSHLSSQKSSFL